MTTRTYSLLAATIFAMIAVLQLIRAILAWPIVMESASGPMSVPLWPSWVAAIVFGALAWLGFRARRSRFI